VGLEIFDVCYTPNSSDVNKDRTSKDMAQTFKDKDLKLVKRTRVNNTAWKFLKTMKVTRLLDLEVFLFVSEMKYIKISWNGVGWQ